MVTNEIDIVLRTISDVSGIDKTMRSVEKMQTRLKKMRKFQEAGVKVDSKGVLRDMQGRFMGAQNAAEKLNKLSEAQKVAADKSRELAQTQERLPNALRDFRRGAQIGRNSIERFGNGLRAMGQSFNMAMLSALFFGLQLKNLATGIARTTIATFMDISDSSNQAVQGINKLKAGFTVLKFAIGEALANALLPFIPAIMEVVQALVNWISENPKLISGILAFVTALGTLLFIAGTLSLGLKGVFDIVGSLALGTGRLAEAFNKMNKNLKKAGKSLSKFGKGFMAFLLHPVTLAVLAILALIASLEWLSKQVAPDTNKAINEISFGIVKDQAGILKESIGNLIKEFLELAFQIDINSDGAAILAGSWMFVKQTFGIAIGIILKVITLLVDLASVIVNSLGVYRAWHQAIAGNFSGAGQTMANTVEDMKENLQDLKDNFNDTSGFNNVKTFGQIMDEINAERTTGGPPLASFGASDGLEDLRSKTEKMTSAITLAANDMTSMEQGLKRVNDEAKNVNFTPLTEQFNEASQGIKTNVLGTEKEEGLIKSLSSVVNTIGGPENSLVNAMDLWIQKMDEASEVIAQKLVPQVNSAKTALDENKSAALDAAKAQERYNRAVQGFGG